MQSRQILAGVFAAAVGLLTLASTACAGHHHAGDGSITGAATPRDAVTAFMGAARATDLQAMSTIWGTTHGPARDQISQDVLEKRETIMVCFLNVDKFEIGKDLTASDGSQNFEVTLNRGPITRTTTFQTVLGPEHRWYVQQVDLLRIKEFCRSEKADSLHYQSVAPQDMPQK